MDMILRLLCLFMCTAAIHDPPFYGLDSCGEENCDEEAACVKCDFPNCTIGEEVSVKCRMASSCHDPHSFTRKTHCLFCWQLPPSDYDCRRVVNCTATSTVLYTTVCQVHSDVLCLGSRSFYKNVRCNWCTGYSWSRALLLSATLGGFGADRFYLGLWKSAIGKLFSFGGLGIWTLVDVLLIAIGYLRPSDGSMYS